MFFQFPDLDQTALNGMGQRPHAQGDMAALESATDRWIAELREQRLERAGARGPLSSLHAHADRLLRTDEPEYLDVRDFPADEKLRMVHALHGMNRVTGAYKRFSAILKPYIERVAERHGRRARLLELASGSGEFTLALAEAAEAARLPVDIWGSDYMPEYVEQGREKARARGLDVQFEVIDAFDMSHCENDAWDLVFIAQSVHHFSPGQLAKMIAQSRRIATTAFVAADGRRSLQLLLFVPGMAALTLRRTHFHDALLTARKFYSETELAEIGQIAAPGARVEVTQHWPGYSVLSAAWG